MNSCVWKKHDAKEHDIHSAQNPLLGQIDLSEWGHYVPFIFVQESIWLEHNLPFFSLWHSNFGDHVNKVHFIHWRKRFPFNMKQENFSGFRCLQNDSFLLRSIFGTFALRQMLVYTACARHGSKSKFRWRFIFLTFQGLPYLPDRSS